MNVCGDADADVGSNDDGGVFDDGVFLVDGPDGEGNREGDSSVTRRPAPEDAAFEKTEMKFSTEGVDADEGIGVEVVEDCTSMNGWMGSSCESLVC